MPSPVPGPSPEERGVEEYDFQETPAEQENLRGGPPSDEPVEPIPNVVHFTWALRKEGAELELHCYLSIRSAIVTLRPDRIYLHHTYLNEANAYWQRLKPHVTLVRHPPDDSAMHVAHKADLLRMALLRAHGGIYMDIDAYALRPFDALRRSRPGVVLGAEGGNRWGLCNALMLARAGAPFLDRWAAAYHDFDSSAEWNFHSVILPKRLAAEHPDEVSTLGPVAFFWPTWTRSHVDFMHEQLAPAQAAEVARALADNEGALYPGQVAYHAWAQMAWRKYLQHLTEDSVRTRDTRFNMMVRRFLE